MMLQANAKEIAINKVLLKQQGELVSGLPLHEGKLGDETGGNTKVFRSAVMHLVNDKLNCLWMIE